MASYFHHYIGSHIIWWCLQIIYGSHNYIYETSRKVSIFRIFLQKVIGCCWGWKDGNLECYKIPNFLVLFPYFRTFYKGNPWTSWIWSAHIYKHFHFFYVSYVVFLKTVGILYLPSLTFFFFFLNGTNHNKFSRNVGEWGSRLSYWNKSFGWFTMERPSTVRLPRRLALMERSSRLQSSKRPPEYW